MMWPIENLPYDTGPVTVVCSPLVLLLLLLCQLISDLLLVLRVRLMSLPCTFSASTSAASAAPAPVHVP